MDGSRLKGQSFTDTSGQLHTMGDLVKIFPGQPKLGGKGQPLKAREPNRYAFNGQVYLDPAALQAAIDLPRVIDGKTGYSVFWNHRSDTAHEQLPDWVIDAQVAVWLLRHDLRMLVLTKRAGRMQRHLSELMSLTPNARFRRCWDALGEAGIDRHAVPFGRLAQSCYDGIAPWWMGVSAENQESYDERIPELRATPAAGHFASLEPMLGPIELRGPMLSWYIIGAEAGPNARPADLDWVRSVRDQVLAARDGRSMPLPGDPHLFVKQLDVCEECEGRGYVAPWGDGIPCPECGGYEIAGNVRKGNPPLDGRSWAEIPGTP